MKILIISRYLPFPGGRENFVYELCQELKKNHEIFLMTPDGLLGEGITVLPYKADNEYLANILDKIKPDIVNSHAFYLSMQSLKLCKDRKIPFIITLHGDQFVIGDKKRQKIIQDVVKNSDRVITVCNNGKESVIVNTQVEKSKISVIHNGLNISKFSPYYDKNVNVQSMIRDQVSLDADKYIFLIPARMVWYKGLEFLLEAIKLNKKIYMRLNLLFCISIPNASISEDEINYLNSILKKIKRYNLDEIVTIKFAGYEYMPFMYQMADGVILPSASEQFPMAILEAMAEKKPVIATNVGGVGEMIEDNITGLLVEYNNLNDLCNAIIKVVKEKDLVQYITTNASININQQFSITESSSQYEELFYELIRSNSVYLPIRNEKVNLNNIDPPKHDNGYLEMRKKVWDQEVIQNKLDNTPLWNGVLYGVSNLSQSTKNNIKINTYLCEYKDLILFDKAKKMQIATNPSVINFNYICVQCVITNGEKYLFGFQGDLKTNFTIISVGGSLRSENKRSIKNKKDIINYMIDEIKTETNIVEPNLNKLKLKALVIQGEITTFLFYYSLSKSEVKAYPKLLKIGEFDGEIFLKKSDLKSKKMKMHPRLESVIGYI